MINLIQTAEEVIAATYTRFPILLTKGQGCRVWDSEGKIYTDFVAGIAVCNLGHAHPALLSALTRQAETLWHVSNLYYTEPQTKLAKLLVQNSFADRVFFCNSGAEANEAAIKIARKYFKEKGEPNRYRIVSCENSFHGRTMATLSATGQKKIQKGFAPNLEGFDFVPFNDLDHLSKKIGPDTCAVLLEPIQGEGGVRCASQAYMKGVRDICDQTGTLLILDEIQTGLGRTGKLFAHTHFEIKPDVMTLAKALANGLPMGAMLATEEVAQAFGPGAHASTFGGTPIVSAVALEVVKALTQEGIVAHGEEMGHYFVERLSALKQKHASIVDVRGMGLLLGMKLTVDGGPVVKACMRKGFLINCVQDTILRFIPPLTVTKAEIDALIDCLEAVL